MAYGPEACITPMKKGEMADRGARKPCSRAALWDEVKDYPAPPGHRPFRGAAAAPVHRPGPGGGSRKSCSWTSPPPPSTPSPPLKIEELIDRLKAQLRHRHRHPQHAAGRPGLRFSPPSSFRDTSSSSARPNKSSPTRREKNGRISSPAPSGDDPSAVPARAMPQELSGIVLPGRTAHQVIYFLLYTRGRPIAFATKSFPLWRSSNPP